ncbi:MAG: hypothetical protein LUC94_05645 [Clostridiales bacterium]|nr:hypothetical protein [Clostridiales bacterium]
MSEKKSLFAIRKGRSGQKNDIYGVKGSNRLWDPFDEGIGAQIHHSSGYHRYFEGWVEIEEKTHGNRSRIRRIYTAPWMVRRQSVERQFLNRICYLLLAAFAVGLYVVALLKDIGSNHCLYVALPGLLTVILIVLALFRVLTVTFSGQRLTLYGYHTCHGVMPAFVMSAAAGSALTALMTLFYTFLHWGNDTGAEVFTTVLLLGSSVSWLCLGMLERATPYGEEDNPVVLPDGIVAHEIW